MKTIKQLEHELGSVDSNYVYLTKTSVKELSEGKPIHCESVMLIPSFPKKDGAK